MDLGSLLRKPQGGKAVWNPSFPSKLGLSAPGEGKKLCKYLSLLLRQFDSGIPLSSATQEKTGSQGQTRTHTRTHTLAIWPVFMPTNCSSSLSLGCPCCCFARAWRGSPGGGVKVRCLPGAPGEDVLLSSKDEVAHTVTESRVLQNTRHPFLTVHTKGGLAKIQGGSGTLPC